MGKPLKAAREAPNVFKHHFTNVSCARALWIEQLLTALKGLQLIHEQGLVCGTFSDETIYCVDDSTAGVLFPLNLQEADTERIHVMNETINYDPSCKIMTQVDDVRAAVLTYAWLRLSDRAVDEAVMADCRSIDKHGHERFELLLGAATASMDKH